MLPFFYMLLIDLFLPKICLSCGFLGDYICSDCQRKIILINQDVCFYCYKRSILGLTHRFCERKSQLDGCLSFLYYDQTLKKILKNIKYRLVKEAFNTLLSFVGQGQTTNKIKLLLKNKKFYLQPIPLTVGKNRERGFNQAEIFASHLSSLFSLTVSDFLIRVREKPPQAQIRKRKDRVKNVVGVFEVKNKNEVKGRNLILVDDVVTTGATLKEAAKVLKKQGANRVYAITIAKG